VLLRGAQEYVVGLMPDHISLQIECATPNRLAALHVFLQTILRQDRTLALASAVQSTHIGNVGTAREQLACMVLSGITICHRRTAVTADLGLEAEDILLATRACSVSLSKEREQIAAQQMRTAHQTKTNPIQPVILTVSASQYRVLEQTNVLLMLIALPRKLINLATVARSA